MPKKLRCYLGLHRFQKRMTDDHQPYEECRDCGKFRDIQPRIPRGEDVGGI